MVEERKVPVLSNDSGPREIKAYLIWLAGSDYWYHIDDDPKQVNWDESVSPETIEQLSANRDALHHAMSSHYGEDYWGLAWDIYGTALDMRELLSQSFEDLCDPDEWAYKAASMCSSIVLGSVNISMEHRSEIAFKLHIETDRP
jgi:hypothetical protein